MVNFTDCDESCMRRCHLKFLRAVFCSLNVTTLVTCRQADCGGSTVPPPTVPISMDGIVQLMNRSSFVSPVTSISVMQLELEIFWAGSYMRYSKWILILTQQFIVKQTSLTVFMFTIHVNSYVVLTAFLKDMRLHLRISKHYKTQVKQLAHQSGKQGSIRLR